MTIQLPRLLLFDVPMHLSNQLSGKFLAKIHCQHGATHEKSNTYLCHTWSWPWDGTGPKYTIKGPTMLENTNDRHWTYTLTHKYTIMHKASFPHTRICTYVWVYRMFFRCSLNRVFMCFEIMLKADRAIQSLALSSGQHFSLSVLLKLWLCRFLLFVQKSST